MYSRGEGLISEGLRDKVRWMRGGVWVMVRSGACDGVTEGEMRGGRGSEHKHG